VTISAVAGKARKQDGAFVVPVALQGHRRDGRPLPFSRADVVLATNLKPESPRIALANLRPYPHSIDHAYRRLLFHGTELRAIASIDGIADDAIAATVRTAPPPSSWLREPLRQTWLADPLALDAAFQLLILWGIEKQGMPNLPAAIGRYRQFRRSFPSGEIRVLARITSAKGPIIRADIEWTDAAGALVARLENGEFVGDAKLATAFRNNRSLAGAT
jgi:hypothetical protein